jgi:hypothetical protein
MASDASASATKEDIRMLMDELGKLYSANEQWKEELKQHFDVVAENIKHDFQRGAIADRVAQHDDDIRVIKRHLNLQSA